MSLATANEQLNTLKFTKVHTHTHTRTQVVPDVHLPAQRPDLDDALTQEVVRLPLQPLLHPGLDVVVLVPDAQLDAVGRVVALAAATERERER